MANINLATFTEESEALFPCSASIELLSLSIVIPPSRINIKLIIILLNETMYNKNMISMEQILDTSQVWHCISINQEMI